MTFAYKITMVFRVENKFRDCLKIKFLFRRVVRVGCWLFVAEQSWFAFYANSPQRRLGF